MYITHDQVHFLLLACLWERSVTYNDTPTTCLGNDSTLYKKEKKCHTATRLPRVDEGIMLKTENNEINIWFSKIGVYTTMTIIKRDSNIIQ